MNPITISALTTHIVALFERDETLRDVWITGEVGTWTRAKSGHIYFGLKDSGATINAVMWRGSASSHSWLPVVGDQVLVHGYVGVYPDRGVYQFYANQIRPAGRGQLYAKFEALKAALAAEGLFAEERKRPLPDLPTRLGVVTSADAAALRDILRMLAGRWPLVDVVIFPTLVQGNAAPAQIVAAIEAANRFALDGKGLDLLIVARGGGSIEDLWAFNDEAVARAIAASTLPIIAGIGHETDFTIAEFVADLRAATPTAAAAAAVPDRADVGRHFVNARRAFVRQAEQRVDSERRHVEELVKRAERAHPRRLLDLRRQSLAERESRLHLTMARRLRSDRERAGTCRLQLDALNPKRVLQRGYSIVQQPDGRVVVGPDGAVSGDELVVRAAQGDYKVIRA